MIEKVDEADLKVERVLGKGGYGIVKKMSIVSVCL